MYLFCTYRARYSQLTLCALMRHATVYAYLFYFIDDFISKLLRFEYVSKKHSGAHT